MIHKHAASIMTLALALLSLGAQAQEYPNKPLRIIVGFSAGGGVDGNMRAVAQSMTKRLGQNVIVENRPGAGGNIGIQYTIGQPADGYTITLVSTAATIASAKASPPYNIEKDLTPIIFFGDVALAIYVNPSLPVKNIQELIAYAKQRPGKLSFASIGVGSTGHLAFEVFKNLYGLYIVHVPYKSTGETTRAVLSGETEIGMDPFSSVGPLTEAGKLRVLAVASAKRHPVSPNVPAMEESGVRNYEFFTWTGLSAPAGTPPAVIQKLNATLNAVLQEPEIKTRLERGGYQVRGGSPEEFGRYISKEVGIWRKVIAQGKFDFEQQ
jgi:tripartite-type tricarboxylate transporter receptor subunit TctC